MAARGTREQLPLTPTGVRQSFPTWHDWAPASQALIPVSETEPSFFHSLFPTPCERQTPWEAGLASRVTSQRKSMTAGTLMLQDGSGRAYALQVGEGEGKRPFLGQQLDPNTQSRSHARVAKSVIASQDRIRNTRANMEEVGRLQQELSRRVPGLRKC